MTRRDSALHASCTGGVVDLTALDDQARQCKLSTVTLPYCPRTGRVLDTEYRGLAVRDAVYEAVADLLLHFGHVSVTDVHVRPWYRWWRPTPAKRIIPSEPRATTGGPRR